jgi:hypothetical protein
MSFSTGSKAGWKFITDAFPLKSVHVKVFEITFTKILYGLYGDFEDIGYLGKDGIFHNLFLLKQGDFLLAAGMLSFMASCNRNRVNEFGWMKDVFERIQSHKQKNLYQPLPSKWDKYRIKSVE